MYYLAVDLIYHVCMFVDCEVCLFTAKVMFHATRLWCLDRVCVCATLLRVNLICDNLCTSHESYRHWQFSMKHDNKNILVLVVATSSM